MRPLMLKDAPRAIGALRTYVNKETLNMERLYHAIEAALTEEDVAIIAHKLIVYAKMGDYKAIDYINALYTRYSKNAEK